MKQEIKYDKDGVWLRIAKTQRRRKTYGVLSFFFFFSLMAATIYLVSPSNEFKMDADLGVENQAHIQVSESEKVSSVLHNFELSMDEALSIQKSKQSSITNGSNSQPINASQLVSAEKNMSNHLTNKEKTLIKNNEHSGHQLPSSKNNIIGQNLKMSSELKETFAKASNIIPQQNKPSLKTEYAGQMLSDGSMLSSFSSLRKLELRAIDFEARTQLSITAVPKLQNSMMLGMNKTNRTSLLVEQTFGFGSLSYSGDEAYSQNRSYTETLELVHGTFLGVDFPLTSKLKLDVGLALDRAYILYQNTSKQIISENILLNDTAFIYANDAILPGALKYTEYNEHKVINRNIQSTLSIPLRINYLLILDRMAIHPFVSTRINLMTNYKGVVLGQNGQHEFDENIINDSYSTNSLSLGYEMGVDLKFYYTQKFHLYTGLVYRNRNIFNATNTDTNFRILAMKVGISYDLSKN